jgi:hypothetical protein
MNRLVAEASSRGKALLAHFIFSNADEKIFASFLPAVHAGQEVAPFPIPSEKGLKTPF